MALDDALQDLHALELDLKAYERKYGLLSETFYLAYSKGEEPEADAWVMDWAQWAGTYEVLQNRLRLPSHFRPAPGCRQAEVA